MAYWVYGRDAASGKPRDPLFIEADSADSARAQAASEGMVVEEVEGAATKVADERRAVQQARKTSAPVTPVPPVAQDAAALYAIIRERLLTPLGPFRRHIGSLGCMMVAAATLGPLLSVKSETVYALALPSFGAPLLALAAVGLVFTVRYSAIALLAIGLSLTIFLSIKYFQVQESNRQYAHLKDISDTSDVRDYMRRIGEGSGHPEFDKLQAKVVKMQNESEGAVARMAITGAWPFQVSLGWAWYPLYGGALLILLAAALRPESLSS
jgi:hypothetical protein